MTLELLLSPGCPHADAARGVMVEALDRLGLAIPIHERVGEFPSPTILVDGVDVMTGRTGAPRARACRLDLPTTARLIAAVAASDCAGTVVEPEDGIG